MARIDSFPRRDVASYRPPAAIVQPDAAHRDARAGAAAKAAEPTPPGGRGGVDARDDLGAAAREIVDAGRAAWPRVRLGVAAVAAHLTALPSLPARGHAAEVYLACACSRGDAIALGRFEAVVIRQVPAMIRHLGDAGLVDEVQQEVRTRLLVVRPAGPPRIAAYGGRGSLAGWVRATAIRVALDLRRGGARAWLAAEASRVAAVADDDPEAAYLRARHGEAFTAALGDALAALPGRVRRALRLHVDGGLSAVRIGALLGVHHATVSRWLLAAPASALAATRRRITRNLGLSAPEVTSLAWLVGAQLDRGLAPVLAAGDDD